MYNQVSSSNKPVRRRRSSDDGCGNQGWTYALVEEDLNQVKWYCPVGAKERLGNKAGLMMYWRKHHGHDRVPSCFNFLTRDVPHWCSRVDDTEEDTKPSCGGGSRGRGMLVDRGGFVSPMVPSAVVSPTMTTKVSGQAFSESSPSSADTTALTPVSSSRREGQGPAAAPGAGVGVAAVRSPMGSAGQENEMPRDARLLECSAASTPSSLSRASVGHDKEVLVYGRTMVRDGRWQQQQQQQEKQRAEPPAFEALDIGCLLQWVVLELGFKLIGKNRWMDPITREVKGASELVQMVRYNPQLMCRYQTWSERSISGSESCPQSDAVSALNLSGGKGKFDAPSPASTLGAEYLRQTDSEMGELEQEEGDSWVGGIEEESDEVLEFTQLDPGVAAAAMAAVAPAVTAASKQEAKVWTELSGGSDRGADGASRKSGSADKGGGIKMDSVPELGDGVVHGEECSSSGEGSCAISGDDDAMDVVSDDNEDSGGEWVGHDDVDVAGGEGGVDAEVVSPAATVDERSQDHLKPVRRVRRSLRGREIKPLPGAPQAYEFLRETQGFRYKGVGWTIVSEDGSSVLEHVEAPQYIADRPRILKDFKEWSRHKNAKEEKDTTSSEEGSDDDGHSEAGEEGAQTEALATEQASTATLERDLEQQSVEGESEERYDVSGVTGVSGSDERACDIGDGDIRESDEQEEGEIGSGNDDGSRSESDDDCDDGGDGGSKTKDDRANQRRVARRRESTRLRDPKPSVPRLQNIWDFLLTEKNWKYRKVGGEYMVAGPDPGSGPLPQSQLRDFMADQPDLLEECKDWLDEEGSEEQEPPKQPRRGRGSPGLRRNKSRRLSGAEQGLPESKYVWEFARAEKGWDYHKDGIHIVGPEPDDFPIEYRDLPGYIVGKPGLRREYNKWRRDQERAAEMLKKEKMKRKKSREGNRRARQQKVETSRKTPARQASASKGKNSTSKRRKASREPISSKAKKRGHGGGGQGKRLVRGARGGSDADGETCKKKRVPRRSAMEEDLSSDVSPAAAPSSESEADSGDSAGDDALQEAQAVENGQHQEEEEEDESSEEEMKAESVEEGGDSGEDSESMDEEEKRTLLMRNLRLEDVNRLYVWQFLREDEDWTYRQGGLESSHIYFKKGTPRGAEVGVHVFRSLEEVRDMVRRDPALRKRFYEYYQKDMLVNSGKVESTGTRKRSNQNGAASAAATVFSDGDAASHRKAKRNSVSPAASTPSTSPRNEPAVCSSQSTSVTTSALGISASSRYPRRATGPTSGEGKEEDDPSPPPQQERKLQVNAKAVASSVRPPRVSKTSTGVSKMQGPGPGDGEKKVDGAKGRGKSPQATIRGKQATGGSGGRRGRSSSIVISETEFIDPPDFPGPKGGTCGVCLGPGSADGSDMFLQCREPRCSSRVHKSCYPVNVRSIHDEFFRCNACASSSAEPKLRGCVICRRTQGVDGYAMIPTKDGQFVHYLCLKKAVRGAESHQYFDKVTKKFSPSDGVTEALARAASRRIKPCQVCHRTGGVLKGCFRMDCRIRFHPLCGAVRAAEVLNESGGGMGLGAEIAILCETHVEQADKDCSTCGQAGTVGNMICCCRCDTHYHKACLDAPMTSKEEDEGATTTGWVCTDCKSACASLAVDGSEEDDDDGEDGDEGEEANESSQDDETQEEEEPPVPGSPEWIGWQRKAKKNVKGKAKGKGKAKNNSPVPKIPSPVATKHKKGRSTKGKRDRSQKSRVKATKAGGVGRGGSAREYALERRRALEAMWSSCEEDDDEFGLSDGEGDSEDGIATSFANASKPRTEAFSAIPVGAQAYFNSHAGVKTLAVIPGGVATAESARGAADVGTSSGAGVTRAVHKRGWHARNKYSRVAREDRLSEERAGRKRARRDLGGGAESGGIGGGSVNDGDVEEDWEAAGAGTGAAGGSAFFGEGGEARVEELLRLTQEPVRDQLDALMSKHSHSFARWKSEMDWGWSLLFYGVGSKRELLKRLEDYVDHQGAGGGTVVGYDGFNAKASVRGLLDSLCEEVLFRKSQELSSASLQTYASNFVKAFESQQRRSASSNTVRMAGAGAGAMFATGGAWRGAQEGELLRRSSVASGRAVRDGVDRFFVAERRTVPRRLFIFVHSIDGEKLRNEDSQAALAELAASPAVHLAASIDHVNAPLMWDVGLAAKFNWAWHKTHTYEPYIEELRNRRAWCSEEDEVLALSRLSMVMKALTPRHVDVVVCLAKKLKSSPELGGKWMYRDLLAELKSNLSADNSQILDLLLVELKDHNVLTDEKSGNSRYLSIPGGPEVVDYLAGYQR